MSPKRNRNIVFPSFSYPFLGIIALAIIVVFYGESWFNNDKDAINNEKLVVPEVNLLSTEEVQFERAKLPPLEENTTSKASPSEVFYDATVSELSSTEVEQIISNQKSFINKPTLPTSNYVESSKDAQILIPEITVPNKEKSGLSVTEEPYYGDLPNKETKLVFEGSIFSIDHSTNSFQMALNNGGGFANIYIKNDTDIIINNKEMNFKDLRVSDIVRAEGLGKLSTNLIAASNVIVTGYIDLNI